MTATSDEIVCDSKTNKRLLEMIYNNILNEIERVNKIIEEKAETKKERW